MKVYPFPSIVVQRQRKYPVKIVETNDSTGYQTTDKAEIGVPLDDSLFAFFVRCHELGHLRWSEKVDPEVRARDWNVPMQLVQWSEDYRIGKLLIQSKVPIQDTPAIVKSVPTLPEAMQLYFCQVGFAAEERARLAAMYPVLAEIEASLASVNWLEGDSAKTLAISLKKALESEFKSEEKPEEKRGILLRRKSETKSQASSSGPPPLPREEIFTAENRKRAKEKKQQQEREGEKTLERIVRKVASSSSVQWGDCTVKMLPLALRLGLGALHGRKREVRSTATGLFVRRPSRLLTGGSPFLRRTKGGSILIDVSGSMCLGVQGILDLLQTRPAVTIGVYSSTFADLSTGEVRIIAKGGKVISESDLVRAMSNWGTGNVVDGPALEWLGRQSGPRIWICDGTVTGVSDDTSPELRDDAAMLKRRFGIVRYHAIRHFLSNQPIPDGEL